VARKKAATATVQGDIQAELSQAEWKMSEDKMSVSGSIVAGLAQDVTQGSTSKQSFRNSTFRCNFALLAPASEIEEARPEETCQSQEDHVCSSLGTAPELFSQI
jgi:hypothetical protein